MTDDEIYEFLGQVFEWDRVKAARNALQHRVRFTEAASALLDRNAVFEHDPDHSEDEQRYVAIGRSVVDNLLTVVHVHRGERFRIISARRPTRSERRDYESRLGRYI